jgi:DNA-binding NarL/FixJ family response regulator
VSEGEIRILVADDHVVVREGIRSMLENAPGLRVVAEASDGNEALALIEREDIDVAVLDITMPGMTGLEVVSAIRARDSRPGVLILSMHDHPEYVLEAVRAGADGYLLKSAGPSEVRRAVQAIARGEQVFGADITRQLGAALRDEGAPRARSPGACRHGPDQPRDRGGIRHQPAYRRDAPREPHAQTGHPLGRRPHALRIGGRPARGLIPRELSAVRSAACTPARPSGRACAPADTAP